MSEQVELVSFEIAINDFRKILQWISAPFDTDKYNQAYINIAEDELRGIASAGNSVASYGTFREPYIKNIDLHDSIDKKAGAESIIRIPQTQNYLDFVGGKDIEVSIYGPEGERGTRMEIAGDLSADIYIPNSREDYGSKALKVTEFYNEDNLWIKNNGEPLKTSFVTNANEFQRVVDVVDFDSFALANYPVVVENGEFVLNASDENNRDSVSGKLYAKDIQGPDVSNVYSRGFDKLFSNISGEIDVHLEDDALMTVVRESDDGSMTLRYSMLPAVSG